MYNNLYNKGINNIDKFYNIFSYHKFINNIDDINNINIKIINNKNIKKYVRNKQIKIKMLSIMITIN